MLLFTHGRNSAEAKGKSKMATATVIAIETIEGVSRTWYQISGHDLGTGRVIEGEYAICEDGSVLDEGGRLLTAGDRETIAVLNLI
jgi:hypothetical protein